jgi:hypothetical protein
MTAAPRSQARRNGCLLALLVGLGFCAVWQRQSLTYAVGEELLSPDGSHRFDWAKRRAFPQVDLIDWAIVVRFRLVRVADGAVVDEEFVDLDEDSDFDLDEDSDFGHPQLPGVTWTAAGVAIRGYDDRRPDANVLLRYRQP